MKRILFFLIALCVFGIDGPAADVKPDFIITDIVVQEEEFIHIKLQNKSSADFPISPELKEKVFLSVYINNIKRADYTVKYMDVKLFKPNGTSIFPTNFRKQNGLHIRVEVNPLKVIPETNFLNNRFEKQF